MKYTLNTLLLIFALPALLHGQLTVGDHTITGDLEVEGQLTEGGTDVVLAGDDAAAALTSGASTDGQVLTSDGAGAAAWENPAVQSVDGNTGAVDLSGDYLGIAAQADDVDPAGAAISAALDLKQDAATAATDAELAAHTGDTENPHEVTAAQVGSYTTAQADAAFQPLDADLTTLAGNDGSNLTGVKSSALNDEKVSPLLQGQFSTGAFTSLSPTIARVSVTGVWAVVSGMVEDMHSDLYNGDDEFTWVVEYHRTPYIVIDVEDLDNVAGTTTATATTEFGHGLEVGDSVLVDANNDNLDGTFTIATVPDDTSFTFDSGYGSDVTDATGTMRESRSYTVAGVGNFWESNEMGYLIRVTAGDELEVVHYGTSTTNTVTTNLTDHVEPGDSGVFVVRKSGTTLEILGANMQELASATVDAEIEQLSTTAGSGTRLMTILGGYYDENDSDGMPQDIWRGTLVETYAWSSALTDAQLRAGLNEWQARNAYAFELTKHPENPLYDAADLLAASDGLLQNWLYNIPVKVSDNNYLLFFGASEHPNSPSNQGVGVAHSNDMFTLQFPLLGLEEVDTGDGTLNFLVESKDAFQDVIEDPTDSSSWLVLSEANDGGSAAALITVPKDFSAGGTDTGDITAASEVKTIWNWQDSGRIAYAVKSTVAAMDATSIPYTTRTQTLRIFDTTDYTGNASAYGAFPEFTSWLQDQDFYGLKVKPWGDVWMATASIYNQHTERIEGFGLYLSEDGSIFEQVTPWALQVSETDSAFDYGQLLVASFTEGADGDLIFPYTGFNALHNDSVKVAKLGFATMQREQMDRARANMLDHAQLTNRKERCYFNGSGGYVLLSSDIVLSGAFDISFVAAFDSATSRQKVIGHDTGNGTLQLEAISNRFRLHNDAGASTTVSYSGTLGALEPETAYTFRLVRDGAGNLDLFINGVDQSVSTSLTGTITLNAIGNGKGSTSFGGDTLSLTISDVTFDVGDTGDKDHQFIGNRNDADGWADQIGGLTATIQGNMAILTYLLNNQDDGILVP